MRMLGPWPKGYGRTYYLVVVATFFVAAIVAVESRSDTLDDDDARRRDDAVSAAREGHYAESLTALEQLRDRYPQELSLLHDYVTILAWSENHTEVVAVAASLVPEDAPRFAQLAVAKSARDAQRFELAADWYDAAIAADPGDTDAFVGRLLTAGDAQDVPTVRRLVPGHEAEKFAALARLIKSGRNVDSAIFVMRLGSRLTRRRALKVVLSRELARSQMPWMPRMTSAA